MYARFKGTSSRGSMFRAGRSGRRRRRTTRSRRVLFHAVVFEVDEVNEEDRAEEYGFEIPVDTCGEGDAEVVGVAEESIWAVAPGVRGNLRWSGSPNLAHLTRFPVRASK